METSATGIMSGKHEKLVMIIASVGGLILAWYLYKSSQANAAAANTGVPGTSDLTGGTGSSGTDSSGTVSGLSSGDLNSIISAIEGIVPGAGVAQDKTVISNVPTDVSSAGTTDVVAPTGTNITLDFQGDNSSNMAIVGGQTAQTSSGSTSTSSGGGGGMFSQIIGILGGALGGQSSGGGTSGNSNTNSSGSSAQSSLIETGANTYNDQLTITNATPDILKELLAAMQTPSDAGSQQNIIQGQQTNTALALAGLTPIVGQQATNQAGTISTLPAPATAIGAGSTADVVIPAATVPEPSQAQATTPWTPHIYTQAEGRDPRNRDQGIVWSDKASGYVSKADYNKLGG
jgi:hypothetical protein